MIVRTYADDYDVFQLVAYIPMACSSWLCDIFEFLLSMSLFPLL